MEFHYFFISSQAAAKSFYSPPLIESNSDYIKIDPVVLVTINNSTSKFTAETNQKIDNFVIFIKELNGNIEINISPKKTPKEGLDGRTKNGYGVIYLASPIDGTIHKTLLER